MVDTAVREGVVFLVVAFIAAVVSLMDISDIKELITWLGLKEEVKWLIR